MSSIGKFIVLDGGEGAGKGSVINELKRILSPATTIFTREPGGSLFAEKIRDVIFDPEAKSADALTHFCLFWASRAEHIRTTINPALKSGKNVICDRYDVSTYAYQIWGQENHDLEYLFSVMRQHYSKLTIPDLYLYLDIDPEDGLERIKGRGDNNHFDGRELPFHRRVRQGYFKFFKNFERNSKIIDAEQPLSVVVEEAKDAILALLV